MSRHDAAALPSAWVLWVDRSLGTRTVPSILREHLEPRGVRVVAYDEVYDRNVLPDAAWIPDITQRGWVILTKDKAISRAGLERELLIRAKARYVALVASNLTGAEQAMCLVTHWRTIAGVLEHRRPPVLVRVSRSEVRWFDPKREDWRRVPSKRRRRATKPSR